MAKYDPNKRYTWGPDSKFELSGQEFGLILNTIRTFLASEEAAKYQLMVQANNVIESMMEKGVESENIKEAPEQPAVEPQPLEVVQD